MENSEFLPGVEMLVYGPGAIVHLLDNSLSSPVLQQLLLVKGIYRKGKGVNYNGMYYDILKDEVGEANMTLMVHETIRQKLQEGQLIEGTCYVTKRVAAATGRIDLILRLSELHHQALTEQDPADMQSLALIRQKAQIGFKDVRNLIRDRIFKQAKVNITVILGTTAIVDQDFLHQLKDSVAIYEVRFVRVNFTRPQDIVSALDTHAANDIVVVVRGGGENLQVFDNIELAQAAITLQPILISAIGHAVDEPLFQKVSDKSFITPTALGQYLYECYSSSIEDIQRSKAKLITDITRQVELSYQGEIKSLNARLTESTQQATAAQKAERERNEQLSILITKQKTRNGIILTLLIISLIIICVLLI
ncbi:exodeoxyribonuclease VII large subunit [Paraflavitalea pollutisoli]|uniref:exodeoxyribonuclease VII large subunit n=1 Tax=Paraflavitalea pollutisoli TaxID=3034143 RepID=UPI0023EBE344|nr:exodeoxyribonuclease VII large subunit [Paraflavitalea sp. H1-2-19X]